MRQNRKNRTLFKRRGENRRSESVSAARTAIAAIVSILVVAIVVGVFLGYNRLHEIWKEQCIITDVSRQVHVETGSQVRPGVILSGFGLTNGANLAEIDFKSCREDLVSRIANIKALTVQRRLPDGVLITVTEREAIARMGLKGEKAPSGRVVDDEGVVFVRRVGTSTLPIIREAHQPGTAIGKHLDGRARAALRLLALCREDEFSSFNILEVDLSARDSLSFVLSNYQRVRIAWDGMDEESPIAGHDSLVRQLTELQKAMKTGIGSRAVVWNATLPGRVCADTKEPIP